MTGDADLGTVSNQDEAPERAVLLTADMVTELLQEGEVEAEVFEPDGDGDLERNDVHVASMSGPHPLYATPSGTSSDKNKSRWLPGKADFIPLGLMMGMVGGMYAFLPRTTLQMNGEVVPFPPESVGIWVALISIFLVLWYAVTVFNPSPRRKEWSA